MSERISGRRSETGVVRFNAPFLVIFSLPDDVASVENERLARRKGESNRILDSVEARLRAAVENDIEPIASAQIRGGRPFIVRERDRTATTTTFDFNRDHLAAGAMAFKIVTASERGR